MFAEKLQERKLTPERQDNLQALSQGDKNKGAEMARNHSVLHEVKYKIGLIASGRFLRRGADNLVFNDFLCEKSRYVESGRAANILARFARKSNYPTSSLGALGQAKTYCSAFTFLLRNCKSHYYQITQYPSESCTSYTYLL